MRTPNPPPRARARTAAALAATLALVVGPTAAPAAGGAGGGGVRTPGGQAPVTRTGSGQTTGGGAGRLARLAPALREGRPEGCKLLGAPPYTRPLWQQERLQFQRAWPFSRGQGVRVAVVDTGVDTVNPQLRAPGIVALGRDLVGDGDGYNVDCDGHGTFVAGIIAARPTGGTSFVGVAPRAQLISVRYSPGGGREAPIAVLAEAIRWAVDHGAEVVNVSSEADSPYPPLRAAVEYAAAHDVLVVAAVGNHGGQGNPVTYPAAFPGVVAVGAIGEDGQLASFSDTAVQVSVVAPGENVVSTSPRTGHVTDSGTSFAAPFVSGVAALVRASHPELSAAQVKRRIELTADHRGGTLPDPIYGWGVVNAYRAVTAILPAEHGAAPTRPAPAPLPAVHLPGPPDHATRDTALAIGAGGLATALLTLAGVATYRRGRARGWRPGAAG